MGNASSLGLLGKLNQNKSLAHVINPVAIVAGHFSASALGGLLDKVPFLQPDPAKTGFQIKSLAKPLALFGLGTLIIWGSQKIKDTGDHSNLKGFATNFGYGFFTAGTVCTVKVIFKKDLNYGLGNAGAPATDTTYYRETQEEINRMLAENSFRYDLPEGGQDREAAEVNGYGTDLEPSGEII